ncbi:hypothetical protein [Micromonospora sp. HUAS LYJ1]|uniref:hypothetical protein n=1 Tax=Micromonospora sp. HUAS LYJ1 TaxID=3061626 RepID=UPI002671372C|nr:hypothetical protein [Micromonospora sp. HUAS LYJ1]WKU02690.1 hypothetical protein Q2K16_17375 [Micromonospora sp. HUAS LYJ1]
MRRRPPLPSRLLPAFGILILLPLLATPASADTRPESIRLLAKAAADECFAGVGVDYPPGPPCAEGQPKVNQSYVWGLAQAGRRLWFGTGANVLCLKPEGYQVREPILNDDYVCEFGRSQPARANPSLPVTLGDHRTPEVFTYDLSTERLTERTADITSASPADANLLRTTAGLRSAAAHQGVVLLGGPSVVGGVNMFAFDTVTGRYLGSTNLSGYENIRHWVVAGGVLYAGVGLGANGGEAGRVLRWTGDRTTPFAFTEVADLPTQVADLTEHQGRLYVSTWPKAIVDGSAAERAAAGGIPAPYSAGPSYVGGQAPRPGGVPATPDGVGEGTDPADLAGIWMSPPLAAGAPGLNPEDAGDWAQVWSAADYEPDPVVRRAYALGGLASFGGRLYWGTMHVPLQATALHLSVYPPRSPAQLQATVQNTQRAFAVFRGQDLGGTRERVETLYGESALPAYDPTANNGVGAWAPAPTGSTPVHGGSGFGDPFNLYAWKMAVAGGRLYVGTMDFAYISLEGELPTPPAGTATSPPTFGADLWSFDAPGRPARAVDTGGFGNPLNQGVRTMVVDGSTLYLGMANPMNLRTDPTPGVPKGGWELIRVSRR